MAGLAVGVPTVSRVATQNGPIKIRLFFTQAKFDQISPHLESFVTDFEKRFSEGLGNAISIQVDVSYRDEPVPLLSRDELNNSTSTSVTRLSKLKKWQSHHSNQDYKTAKHANILIGKTKARTQGVGIPTLTSSCCSESQRFGVVWSSLDEWPTSSYRKRDIYWMIAHEVGHNLGLTHAHGCNHELDARSVMLKTGYAERFKKNMFGEDVVKGQTERVKFNNKITKEHLAL